MDIALLGGNTILMNALLRLEELQIVKCACDHPDGIPNFPVMILYSSNIL